MHSATVRALVSLGHSRDMIRQHFQRASERSFNDAMTSAGRSQNRKLFYIIS